MQNKFSGSIWSVAEYAFYPLLVFATTPFFLHSLGAERYGCYMLLGGIVGLGVVLSAGTGAATIKYTASALNQSDAKSATTSIVQMSLAMALVGGASLAGLICVFFWYIGGTLFEKMGDLPLIRLTGLTAAVVLLIEQLDNVYSSALKGGERFGIVARIEILTRSVQTLGALAAVYLWHDLSALYVSLIITAAFRLVLKGAICKSYLGLGSLWPTFREIGKFFEFAKWGWLSGAGVMMFGVADRFVVGAMLGSASLAHYAIATQLAQQIHGLNAAAASVIFPATSRLAHERSRATLWRMIGQAMCAIFCLSTLMAVILLFCGEWILVLWVGAETARSVLHTLQSFVIAYWLLAMNIVPYYLLLGVGRVRLVGILVLVAGCCALLVMTFAIQHYGVAAIASGRIAYACFTAFLLIPLFQYFKQKPPSSSPRPDPGSP